jgi:hypothetical protein
MPKCEKAGLTIWSDTSATTHCLIISTGILPESSSQNISMRLFSHTNKRNSGFLLRYYG